MLLYISIVLFTLIAFYIIHQQNDRRIRLINKIPGPKGYPVIGGLLLGLNSPERIWEIISEFNAVYGPIMKVWLGPYVMIATSDPDDIEIILSSQKHIEKGFSYDKLQPWLNTGLLTSYGDKWRQRRKILTPAFHFNILKKYMDITNENGEKFVQELRNEGNETIQKVATLCSKYTLNIISESAMGVSLDGVDNKQLEEYKDAVYTMGNIVIRRISRPYLTDWFMKMTYILQKWQDDTLKILHSFTHKVIAERKEYHNNTDYKFLDITLDEERELDDVFIVPGRKKRLAMLDLLLSSQRNNLIDDQGIREEVDTFMFEGHDTTGMAMTFALMLLAENGKIQEKARAEVTEILDRSDGKLGMTEIQQMNYLERCIKESLRLYPSVSVIARYLSEDLQLKDYLIPAKTEIFCGIFYTHRNPKYWPEPDKFDPDRFLPEKIQGRHPFSYIPFSAGPRNCIGQKFAMMELKSLISRILYNFKLEPIDKISDMKILLDIVIRPAKPVHMKFTRIEK